MRDTILCLCDLTGVMARPWVEHGYRAVLVDPQHGITHEDGAMLKLACTIEEAFNQISVLLRSGRLAFVAGFPPCTDMAVSGAQWFARKYEADHLFQAKAVSVAEQCRVIGEMSGVPYMVENPVSVLSNVFGKPSHTFDPCDYTRFAPEDNYTKKTCLWTGGIPNASSQPGHESAGSRPESYLVHERQRPGQQSQQDTVGLRPSGIRNQSQGGKQMNLLDETKSAISRSKHSTDDVRFVGSRDEKLGIPWSQAEKVLDIDYDAGYGGQEIAADLVVVFTDGGFLRREEYDGSEWWEYEPPFRGPETQKPFKLVKLTSYRTRLLVEINYPMEATEE